MVSTWVQSRRHSVNIPRDGNISIPLCAGLGSASLFRLSLRSAVGDRCGLAGASLWVMPGDNQRRFSGHDSGRSLLLPCQAGCKKLESTAASLSGEKMGRGKWDLEIRPEI
jgi:hypothetical protein